MEFQTDNIRVCTTERAELPELNELYAEAQRYFTFDPSFRIVSPSNCIDGDDLPTGGRRENYDLLSIRIFGTLIGYTAVYRDYPIKNILRIPFIYIGEAARGNGSGSAVLEEICRYFANAGYSVVRTTVSLRDWNALRFFISRGFRTISGISAEGSEADGNYGGIVLDRSVRETEFLF